MVAGTYYMDVILRYSAPVRSRRDPVGVDEVIHLLEKHGDSVLCASDKPRPVQHTVLVFSAQNLD